MTPIAEQLAKLKKSYPAATGTALPSGAFLVEIPDYKLPAGWNRNTITVSFLAPVGYPAARPAFGSTNLFFALPAARRYLKLPMSKIPSRK
jgi:hypothetical protein